MRVRGMSVRGGAGILGESGVLLYTDIELYTFFTHSARMQIQ